jgi:hypothetical protein
VGWAQGHVTSSQRDLYQLHTDEKNPAQSPRAVQLDFITNESFSMFALCIARIKYFFVKKNDRAMNVTYYFSSTSDVDPLKSGNDRITE